MVNHKKVYRLIRNPGVAILKRSKRKGVMVEYSPIELLTQANQTWSMDSVVGALTHGCRIKCLTILDDYINESLNIPVAYGISRDQLAREFDAIAQFRAISHGDRNNSRP